MKILNKTKETLIAFTWDTRFGSGDDIKIEPNQTGEPIGPFIGEMGGGECRLVQEGKIVCQENPDDKNGFQVLKGKQLELKTGTSGVTVRHFSEEIQNVYWPLESSVLRNDEIAE